MTELQPLGYVIKRAQQAIRQAMDKALSNINLTTPQYVALNELSKASELSNAELARCCFVTPQTMHQLVMGLEARGFVIRTAHPKHGRIQQVSVTKLGHQSLNQAHQLVDEIEKFMITDLSKKQIEQTNKVLTSCFTVLEGYEK